MKPSAAPREPKFRDPATPFFLEQRDGQVVAHLFSYADARRVQVNVDGEFSQHAGAWLPPGEQHVAWSFMWSTDPGKDGRHDVLRGLVEPCTATVNAFALSSEFGEFDYLRTRLHDDRAIAVAAEEVIRYAPPFPTLRQAFTVKPAVFGTLEIPPYAQVLVHYEAANRSPEVNGNNVAARDPQEFDPRRWPNHHQGFGVGVHHCLGAALAWLEITVAWRELLRHLPGLCLDESKPFERFTGMVDGVVQAPFVFDQQAAEILMDTPDVIKTPPRSGQLSHRATC